VLIGVYLATVALALPLALAAALAVVLLVALGLAFRLTSEWRQRFRAADTTSP
jgi:hypothetical protein